MGVNKNKRNLHDSLDFAVLADFLYILMSSGYVFVDLTTSNLTASTAALNIVLATCGLASSLAYIAACKLFSPRIF